MDQEAEEDLEHGGSHRAYMRVKRRKLLEQQKSHAAHGPQLFAGLSVYINGFTEPPREQLEQMIANGGGEVVQVATKYTTHIIATSLATSKLAKERTRRQGSATPIVLPHWVLESVAAGKALPAFDYVLPELRQHNTLSFARKAVELSASASAPASASVCNSASVTPAGHGTTTSTRRAAVKLPPRPPRPHPTPHPPLPTSSRHPSRQPLPACAQRSVAEHVPSPTPAAPAASTSASAASAGGPTGGSVRSLRSGSKNYWKASRFAVMGDLKKQMKEMVRSICLGSAPVAVRAEAEAGRGKIAIASATAGADASICDSSLAAGVGTSSAVTSERVVLHIDLDCFFASVALRDAADELRAKPVAIAHAGSFASTSGPGSGKARGTSELSCVNYPARRRGLRANMWLAQARELCPELVVLPYPMDAIVQVSTQFFQILARHVSRSRRSDGRGNSAGMTMEVVSCDEAYVELSPGSDAECAIAMAHDIRREVYGATRCTVSVGIGPNKLLARVATKYAKPSVACAAADAASASGAGVEPACGARVDAEAKSEMEAEVRGLGVYAIDRVDAPRLLRTMSVRELPGVGWKQEKKLIHVIACKGTNAGGAAAAGALDDYTSDETKITVAQVRQLGRGQLQRLFGPQKGSDLFDMCVGYDNRRLASYDEQCHAKSMSVEQNYAIRYKDNGKTGHEEAAATLRSVAMELHNRLAEASVWCAVLELKILVRKHGAKIEPTKWGGHGPCDRFVQRDRLRQPTSSVDELAESAQRMLKLVLMEVVSSGRSLMDFRGVGMHATELVDAESVGRTGQQSAITSFLCGDKQNDAGANDTIDSDRGNDSGVVNNCVNAHNRIDVDFSDHCEGENDGGGQDSGDGDHDGNSEFVRDRLRDQEGQLRCAQAGTDLTTAAEEEDMLQLPPLSQLDSSVFKELPDDIRAEVEDRYAKRHAPLDASERAAAVAAVTPGAAAVAEAGVGAAPGSESGGAPLMSAIGQYNERGRGILGRHGAEGQSKGKGKGKVRGKAKQLRMRESWMMPRLAEQYAQLPPHIRLEVAEQHVREQQLLRRRHKQEEGQGQGLSGTASSNGRQRQRAAVSPERAARARAAAAGDGSCGGSVAAEMRYSGGPAAAASSVADCSEGRHARLPLLGHLSLFAPTTPQHLPRRLAEWMRAVLHSHRGIQPAHERLLTEFACEMVRARFLVQAQDLMRAVRRALLSDKLLLASPWRKFYEMHLVPLVQECVHNAFDGGCLKLQPLSSNMKN